MADAAATATAPTQTERPNRVEITDAGPCRKKIAIEIPAETVNEQLGSSLDTLMIEAELPGFRKGRAPRRLIQKKFGTAVQREAKTQLVASAYSRAVEEHKLRVIGDPIAEGLDKVELLEGKALAFEFEVEVPPNFDLPALEGIPVRKPILEVTDEMVAEELERIALHEGRLEPRDKPEPGDYLTGHGKMTGEDGTIHLDIADAVIQVPPPEKKGKGMILGILVGDFGDQLGLPKPGGKVTIKAVAPELHENEAIRAKPITMEFAVARVDRIIPASIDDLLKRYGMASAGDLRDAVRTRISSRVLLEQQAVQRQQIARFLLDHIQMDLPELVTANQAARNLARQRLELMHRGMDPLKIEERLAELRAASSQTAVRELKLFFILDKAAETLDIKVSDAEINGRIAQIAASRNERPDKVRQELIQRGQVGSVYAQVREHKTMDAILGKAKVTEMPAADFNKFIAEQNKAEAAATGSGAPAKSHAAPRPAKVAKAKDDEDEKKPAKKTTKKTGKKAH